ncbi:MAG: PRD domain-containing protein [Lachnospira sp.]|nr:PRD domain-containing protein [Lachnospira sp.]
MQITKVINNNVVSACDDKNSELVIMGCGIGFKKKPGDLIDRSLIEKKFRLENAAQMQQLVDLMTDLPSSYLTLVGEIIQKVSPMIEGHLSNSLYITLTDHLHFAVERAVEGIHLPNPLRWDIKQIYPREYAAALIAVSMTEDMMDVKLEEDEAASIAIHFVNAELNSDMPLAVKVTDVVQGIVNIIQDFYGDSVDEHSVQFERILAHIRLFSQRILAGTTDADTEDDLYDILIDKYQESFECAKRIREYVEKEYKVRVSDEEMTYLIVYLRRITR